LEGGGTGFPGEQETRKNAPKQIIKDVRIFPPAKDFKEGRALLSMFLKTLAKRFRP
jgi:hypothetical protein